MYLIQFFLPLYDTNGEQFTKQKFVKVQKLLTDKFGGITSYVRSPAAGFWKDASDHVVKDDVILFEVVTDQIERDYWKDLKTFLLEEFQQEEILLRGHEVFMLE